MAGDAIGREYYEHGARPGQGYRNGIRPGRMKTAEGFIEYSAPQIAGRDEPFRSAIREHLKGHTQALEDLAIEMLARGLSVRELPSLEKIAIIWSDCRQSLWNELKEQRRTREENWRKRGYVPGNENRNLEWLPNETLEEFWRRKYGNSKRLC